jgi:hypothetical protein
MRKAAKTLIAGTIAAIPLQLLLCGAATSQTAPAAPNQVVIDQVQLGDVFSNVTLNVVTAQVITANNSAVGNSATVGTDDGDLHADVKQSLKANVNAETTLNLTGSAGTTVLNTSAYGNAGEAVANDGTNMSGGVTQRVGAGELVKAGTRINGDGADLGDITSVQSAAVANTQGIGVTGGGTASMVVDQKSAATTQASESMQFKYTAGEVDMASTAVSNNITATGTTGSSQILTTSQKMVGDQTLAYSAVTTGNAQTINNVATATANNMSVSNDGGPVNLAASQVNKGYVRAQTTNVAAEYGTNNAMSYGVGNSMTVGEQGVGLYGTIDQVNHGGVTAVSDVSGTDGYDSQATSVAMGNAVTGYACSSCGGVIDINSHQTNTNNITANSSVTVGNSGRSVSGVSTAVGNSATYYASRPSGG